MKRKKKYLLKISLLSGLIPLLGGCLIFLIWLSGRHFNATDLPELAIAGFFWIIICFFIAIFGLLILGIYTFINRKNLHVGMLITLLVILLNIPSVFLILPVYGKQEKLVFIKLYNETGLDNIEFTLIGKIETLKIGTLNNTDSKIFHYKPTYSFMGERIYQEPDSLRLVLSNNQVHDTIAFPAFRMGACKHLIVDEELLVKSL